MEKAPRRGDRAVKWPWRATETRAAPPSSYTDAVLLQLLNSRDGERRGRSIQETAAVEAAVGLDLPEVCRRR